MQLRKRIRHLFQPRALVLMYHRIASLQTDPWQLAVTPANFEQHLQVLQKTGNLVSVKSMVSSIHNKTVKSNTLCLTFDDGYIDNFLEAKPLLEKYQSPATFFIPTHYTGLEQAFWWDELEDIMLRYPVLPSKFSMLIRAILFEFDLKEDNVLTAEKLKQNQAWAWPGTSPTRRCELYLSIWEKIRPLPFAELQLAMNEIKSWAGFKDAESNDGFPMTSRELDTLATHSLIDIGLHTNTHPALAYHTKEEQHREISGNKQKLESVCGRPVETIAYPYGSYNETTLDVAMDLGVSAGFTTSEKIVSNLTDPRLIGRFQVRNLNGIEFERWLQKLKQSPQFL